MIARLDSLKKHQPVFRHLTEQTDPAFDALVDDMVPTIYVAYHKSLNRPNRAGLAGRREYLPQPVEQTLVRKVFPNASRHAVAKYSFITA